MPLNSIRSHARSLRTRLMLWNAGSVAATGLFILLALRVARLRVRDNGIGISPRRLAVYIRPLLSV